MNCWIRCRSHWMKLYSWGNTQLNLLSSHSYLHHILTLFYWPVTAAGQTKRRSKAQVWWEPSVATSWWLDDPWLSSHVLSLEVFGLTPCTRINSASLCPTCTWVQRWAAPAHEGPCGSSQTLPDVCELPQLPAAVPREGPRHPPGRAGSWAPG